MLIARNPEPRTPDNTALTAIDRVNFLLQREIESAAPDMAMALAQIKLDINLLFYERRAAR